MCQVTEQDSKMTEQASCISPEKIVDASSIFAVDAGDLQPMSRELRELRIVKRVFIRIYIVLKCTLY